MDINSILIVLPVTKGSFILGHHLLSRNLTEEVKFFWDECHEMKHMSQDFADLELLYTNGRVTHINNTDWSRLKIIIIPSIDILPDKPDRSFATMAKNLFGDKLKDIKFHPEVTVFFGSNFRGLIVANEFGKIFPELRKSVYVISSMFFCSRKGYEVARCLPGKENTVITLGNPGEKVSKFDNMGGVQSFGSLGLSDAVAIAEGVEHFLKNNGNLELVEMVGSFPSDFQAEKHILEKDLPYFLPTDYDQLTFTNPENYVEYKMYGNYLEGITKYFLNSYK